MFSLQRKITAMNKGILLNMLSVLVMSLSPLINKFSLSYISPIYAALFSSIFAAMFCFIYSKITNNKINLIKNKFIWIVGLTNATGIVFLYISLDLLSPVIVGFIGRFYIIFAILLSVILLKEKFSNKDKILIILAIIGTFLFVEKDTNGMHFLGILIALCYTFLFAFTNTMVKITIKNSDSNSILFYNNLISVIFISLFIFFTGRLEEFSFNYNGITLVLVSAFFSGFLGLLLFYEGLKHIEFSTANLIRSSGPIIVAAYSWWFFPVTLSLLNILGAILLLCSILLISTKPKIKNKKESSSKEVSTVESSTK